MLKLFLKNSSRWRWNLLVLAFTAPCLLSSCRTNSVEAETLPARKVETVSTTVKSHKEVLKAISPSILQKEQVVENLKTLGYSHSDATEAVMSLSDEDVIFLSENPDVIKRNGVVVATLVILGLIVVVTMLIVWCKKKKISCYAPRTTYEPPPPPPDPPVVSPSGDSNNGKEEEPEPEPEKTIKIIEDCPDCKGKGKLPCKVCGGKGIFEDIMGNDGLPAKCPSCNGTGVTDVECSKCNGTGKITREK